MKDPDPAHIMAGHGSSEGEAALALSDAECDRLFEPLQSCGHVLVAVSGGVDSSLLLVLLHDWVRRSGRGRPALSVAVVDHALRRASLEEAQGVCALALELSLPAAILTWEGTKPGTGLQEAARQARYRLLIAHAKAIGADGLALAHHADDQSETVLMRLCAGSGLDGLSGMRQVGLRDGLVLYRPLLEIGKQRLVATALKRGMTWVDDPSNLNDRFTRVRFRKARDFLASAGLDAVRLNRLAVRMARAQDALEQMADRLWQDVAVTGAQEIVLAQSLFEAPDEIRIRLLMRACAILVPDAPQRLERFESLLVRLTASAGQGEDLNSTIAGCLVRMRKGQVRITVEPPRRRGREIGL